MSNYYRKWAIAIAIQVVFTAVMGGGKGSFFCLLLGGFCLAPGWLGLVGSIEDATSQSNQTRGNRLFAAIVAAPATLSMVIFGGLLMLMGWAIAVFSLLT